MRPIHHFMILVSIFFAVYIIHFSSGVITPFDSRWSIHTAVSIIKERNTNLNEYRDIIEKMDSYAIQNINGYLYTIYPIGASIIAVPFVFIIDKLLYHISSVSLEEHIKYKIPGRIELIVGCFAIALSSVFIYLISYNLFGDKRPSLLLVFIFAFCTSSWSTASRALWQHGPSMLMLSITLYLILLAINNPWLIQFIGIPLTFSYVIRPTNNISILLITIFVIIYYRKYFMHYIFWSMIIAIPFLLFNLSVYHSLLSPYYLLPSITGPNPHPFEALLGNLISPSRGLFVFSPILLFSIYGVIMKIKKNEFNQLDYFLLSAIVLHWMIISFLNPIWWAGHSFGPRLFSDVIPYFIYFLAPVVAYISKLKNIKKLVFVSFFSCFILFSFFVHYRGATSWDVYVWNSDPVDVNVKPARVWDWRDVQFLRGIR